MASKTARPGRRLIAFALVVAALYGGVALSGEWKPKLGLDLQGGQRITLEATTDNGEKPSAASLEEARGIIDQRVNGTGVTEAEVSTQGGRNIVVEVPGQNPQNLVDTVKQTAQLRFRLVAAVGSGQPQPTASPSPSASPSPARPSGQPVREAVGRGEIHPAHGEGVAERDPQGPCPVRRRAPRQDQAVEVGVPVRQGERLPAPPYPPRRRRTPRARRSTSRCSGWTTRATSGSRSSRPTPAPRARRRPRRSTTSSRSRWSPVTRTATSCCCPRP